MPATAGPVEHEPPRAPSFADALVRIAEEVEAGALEPSGRPRVSRTGGERTSLVVHLGPDAVEHGFAAQLDDGSHVSAETFRRLACDCGLVTVSEDASGEPLDVGRKTRSIPPALRRAVMLRDRGCAFPGCTHDRFIDCHHIEHWAHGGATRKDNLVALCTFHHRLLHEGGWSVRWDVGGDVGGDLGGHLGEDLGGDLHLDPAAPTNRGPARPPQVARFITPDGRALPAAHAAPPSQDGGALLERLLRDQLELALDDETAYPHWDGRAPDYHACVQAICAPQPARSTRGRPED